MLILIDDLPVSVSEDQIMQLISEYDSGAGVRFIENLSETDSIACVVTLTVTSHVVADTIVSQLDGLYWQGVQISAHRLLFG